MVGTEAPGPGLSTVQGTGGNRGGLDQVTRQALCYLAGPVCPTCLCHRKGMRVSNLLACLAGEGLPNLFLHL